MPKCGKGYLKLKKEIRKMSDYNRGHFTNFYIGYIHGVCDSEKYGKITIKEAQRLERITYKGLKAGQIS